VREHAFEGILPNLERRYRETDSVMVREELAKYLNNKPCPECGGTRLRREARFVKVGEGDYARPIYEVSGLPLTGTMDFFRGLSLDGQKAAIADRIVKEIVSRLQFLNNVGLDYLALDRSAETLSGGESQRIRLASQIGSGLTGVMYVLDEPSIGLHQRDNDRLLATLKHLRDLGNSVIVVEHTKMPSTPPTTWSTWARARASWRGRSSRKGRRDDIRRAAHSRRTISGGPSPIPNRAAKPRRSRPRAHDHGRVGQQPAERDGQVAWPVFLRHPGVSGSGKSTLINDTLYHAVARHLYDSSVEPALTPRSTASTFRQSDHVDGARSAARSSNPATTPAFTPPRIVSQEGRPRSAGYGPGRFSFNVKGGRCEACQGAVGIMSMHFPPDATCRADVCHGQRYNRETGDPPRQEHPRSAVDGRAGVRVLRARASRLRANCRHCSIDGPGLHHARPVSDDAVGREAQRVKLALSFPSATPAARCTS
jgi:excinuclease ABC subunit A